MLKRPVDRCDECPLSVEGVCRFAPKKLRANAVVTAQGSTAASVGFVKRGIVTLTTVNSRGSQTWGAVRGPRSVLGLEAVVGGRSEYEVRTLTDAEICGASPENMAKYFGTPASAATLFQLALGELLEQRRDVDLRTGTVEGRVARFALICERLIGRRGVATPFSKARVAALIGIRPETLSRVLRRFTDRGLLDSSKGVRVLDRAALEVLAKE